MQTTNKKVRILNLILILITLLAIGSAAYLWFENQAKNTTILIKNLKFHHRFF